MGAVRLAPSRRNLCRDSLHDRLTSVGSVRAGPLQTKRTCRWHGVSVQAQRGRSRRGWSGLVIAPKLHDGFRFEVHDVKEHRRIFFDTPEELYDLLVFIGATGRHA